MVLIPVRAVGPLSLSLYAQRIFFFFEYSILPSLFFPYSGNRVAPVVTFNTVVTKKFVPSKKTKLLANVVTVSSCVASWSFLETGFAVNPSFPISSIITTPAR